jgi:hypothetical protein
MDATTLLDTSKANYYQSLVVVLRWIIEFRRIDITIVNVSSTQGNAKSWSLVRCFPCVCISESKAQMPD